MKICFLIPSVASGGIETYLLRFIKHLIYKGINPETIIVIIRNSKKGELLQAYRSTGVKIVFMPLGYLNPAKIWRYYRFFRIEKPDVIVDFNANFAGISIYIGKLAHISNRITFYRQGSDHFRPNILKRLYNKWMNFLVYKNSNTILFNSFAALDYFFPYRKAKDNRYLVIYNGINKKDFELQINKVEARKLLGLPKKKFIIGHVGRYDKSKNHHFILDVASEILRNNSDLHFVFCGRDTEKLQKVIDDSELSQHVSILGYRNDIPVILNSFDLFFFPSVTEGQPNALIEAMITGLPFVTSNIPSIKEIVPANMSNQLINPFSINEAKEKILNTKRNINMKKELNCKEWAINLFDGKKRFDHLYEIIYQNK